LVASAFRKLTSGYRTNYYYSDAAGVYDFLYDHKFPAWLCNAARNSCSTYSTRNLQDFLMQLHTGEAQYPVTIEWSWQQREKLGQQHLQQLAEAILNHCSAQGPQYWASDTKELILNCRKRLDLDGFTFRGAVLVAPEEDALDAKEEAGVLQQLYKDLKLGEAETALHHLQLSEEHYLAGRWDDSIANSRKFLECVLREVAQHHSLATNNTVLPEDVATRPVRVRDYLESAGLIEAKEKSAIASTYGLLSETGGHPYMAQNEQARLLRHLALTLSQFVMIRLRGSSAKKA
jgi:hypothetical protein